MDAFINPASLQNGIALGETCPESQAGLPDTPSPDDHSGLSPTAFPIASISSQSAIIKFQVCSSCRRKKRRCSLERPTCSLCRENGWTCEYRHIKRKPGPAKGSVGLRAHATGDQSRSGLALTLSTEAKRKLVNIYFAHIQPSLPLFRRKAFDQDFAEKRVPDSLVNAIFAVASKLLPEAELRTLLGVSRAKAPWDTFARLAERQIRERETRDSAIVLNDVKTEILLTLYEYTSFPGRRAWMKVGNVVRMALGFGLHRLDTEECSPGIPELEVEEHRMVWWAVWKLDSSINILSGSPFGIDSLGVGTALPTTSVAEFTAGVTTTLALKYLPTDAARPWQSAPSLLLTDTNDGMGMYLLAVNHLRTVTVCRQRLLVCPTIELANHLTVLRNSLACMRLSLPGWYFEPVRESAFESPERHRLRLETILILYIGHMQAYLPFSNMKILALTHDDGPKNWKTCVSAAEDVADVFHHWKHDYFKVADPMVSSIVWFSHSILNIHSISAIDGPDEAASDPKILNALDLLHIALENFANLWHISRILLDSVNSLQVWSWLKIGFPDVLSLLMQLRIPIDPLKKEPGTIDLWQVAVQQTMEIEDQPDDSTWVDGLNDWEA